MPFVCYSGVPVCYIQKAAANEGLQYLKILCAARLVGYKNVGSIIDALSQLEYDCKLSIVGEGPLRGDLEKQMKFLGIEGEVSFLGKISREHLQEEMHHSTMFVLISEHEVFGLVYIEAMLQGCIVVASRESGADGIIVDGVNGFLCEAGNCYELAEIIRRVARMGGEERKRLSHEAQETAKRFADSKVAEMYLRNISY
jgi:glycosyltransferase involved in cell wall biosynthesis